MAQELSEQYFCDKLEKLSRRKTELLLQRNEYRRKRKAERDAEETRKIVELKKELSSEYGIAVDAKFEKAWNITWDRGHSSGLDEVRSIFGELVELFK
jgi:hypothetical protein